MQAAVDSLLPQLTITVVWFFRRAVPAVTFSGARAHSAKL